MCVRTRVYAHMGGGGEGRGGKREVIKLLTIAIKNNIRIIKVIIKQKKNFLHFHDQHP